MTVLIHFSASIIPNLMSHCSKKRIKTFFLILWGDPQGKQVSWNQQMSTLERVTIFTTSCPLLLIATTLTVPTRW